VTESAKQMVEKWWKIGVRVQDHNRISAEHSTLDEIVGRAQDLEKVLASVESGRSPDRQGIQSGTTSARRMPQRTAGSGFRQQPRAPPTSQPQDRANAGTGSQIRRPEPRQTPRDRDANPSQPTPKGDISKLTCYRCGKVGHIASDTKCPQYQKPEQRQIYAAQVVDDRSDDGQLDHKESMNAQAEAPESGDKGDPEEGPGEHQFQDDCLDGSQYDDERSPYDDYNGYALPSDDEEPVYIRAMSDDEDASSAPNPTQFSNVDWKSRRDILRGCYQQAPYLHGATCEFTPQDGITHPRACETCANYKKHLLVAEAIDRLEDSEDSSAWKVRNKYEQELIRLGWDLAHEGGHVPQDASAVEALARRNHQLTIQLGAVRNYNAYASREYKRLVDEPECARLDAELRDSEADRWQDQYRDLQRRYKELEERLMGNQPVIPQASDDEDIQMRSSTSDKETSDRNVRNDRPGGSLTESVGVTPWNDPTRLTHPDDGSTFPVHLSTEAIVRIAAAREDVNLSREREFRSAQHHDCMTGECPQTSGLDRRCMAALVKVNGLEAYALLDTGSTTVLVTHNFAQVAKLKVMQLENPVPLQLRTVGSRSMINFGVRTQLELGPARGDDTYLDVVNIDRYDMIISTPFMRKHGLVLDFEKDALTMRGEVIPTLTAGQEDLMLAKKRASRVCVPIGQPACALQ